MQRPVASFAVWLVAAIWLHDASAQPPERLAGEGLVPEKSFLPPTGARRPQEPFNGTLVLAETAMSVEPASLHTIVPVDGDPRLFPAAHLTFVTLAAELVPESEDVQRIGSARQGRSYWDIIVQPGQVWSQSNERGWSRATFPFALVNSFENETHNGVATFRYRHGEVSGLRFQITAQTLPFVVDTVFTAHGTIPARFVPLAAANADRALRIYHLEKRDAIPFADWKSLSALLGRAAPALDPDIRPSELLLDGVDYRGKFYLRTCAGAAGPLIWCERRRFGVWSATKSLANATALLRLAQKYGPAIFAARVADYVPELRVSAAWRGVRFRDAIGMATGIGNGSPIAAADAVMDGYEDGVYMEWYFARSAHEKLLALARDSHSYPWGPGKAVRYRDQDMFTLGVALDRYLKSKAGPSSDIWSMLQTEVFEPIGIHQAPMNRTLEEAEGAAPGQPIMAWGYYPTIGDMVKIARLYHAQGEWAGKQILYRPRVELILDTHAPHGLPAGPTGDGGELDYYNAFWRHPYLIAPGCRRYIAEMNGYGDVSVALMPGTVTAIRVARAAPPSVTAETTAGLLPATALSAVCKDRAP